jgi:hypothetical protein
MSRAFRIQPPPTEKCDEPLFRVIYVIDVNAVDALEAAKLTHQIMTDPDSMLPVLEVMDHKGQVEKIDLSEKI